MEIYDSNGTKLEYSAVLANLPITESCEHVEELMKADHIVLSWRDSEKYTLPVGAYITYKGVNYALLEPYEPEQKSADEFEYTPNFQHPKMYLGKVPFRFPTTDTDGNSITLLEWPYSGDIDTLLTFFCRTIESELGLAANTFNYSILGEIDMVVSTTFSSVDILSALSDIANKLKCEWHIDWDYKILYVGHIKLSRDEVEETVLEVGVNVGTPSVRSSKEGFYNTYEPQGSTRNITKRAASGEYVQGDVRLALNEEDFPDKVIYTNESGTIIASLPEGQKAYIKPLIYDNIYPKLDLYVYDVRCRERYLLDDNGKKIIDHYEGSTPIYKRYAVWYMRLAYPTRVDGHVTQWNDYTINPQTDIISGKNLGGAFQPNTYEDAESFPLAGRGSAEDGGYGFELHYHATGETIPANPTDGDSGVVIKAGDYEIVFQEQNDYILPTTASQGIIPKGVKVNGEEVTNLNALTNLDDGQKGNIVDLYNIVINSAYTKSAQDELANETRKYIANQFKDNNSYTLKSDAVAFKKKIDQDETSHTDSSLYIGKKVTYKNGSYELETRVMKLTTKLDFAFVQEIVVGNEVLKGAQTTLKEQVQTILSGGGGQGSGVDSGAVRKIVQAYTNPRFLSKINDDTAQGFITMLKGLQLGETFDASILGEGGIFRRNEQTGLVELVADTLYVRMRAYFDTVVVREYKHESGNRIVSPAQGFIASRVEWIQLVEEEEGGETIVREVVLEQTEDNKSKVDFFRCYWRVDDGEKNAENQFVVGDLAFCEHADVVNGSLVTKRYWRVVVGRNAGNTTTEDGEAWIDLSNAHDANGAPVMTTISWEGQGGVTQTLSVKSFESSTNGIPEAHDDICMLGCVVDTTRQGAIIEYVSGTDAPTYQIYQGLGSDATNPYVLTNKNQISFGYNSSTGKAYMKVYGDTYIGDRNRNTFLEYKQNGAGGNPELNIKAKVQILPDGSTIDGQSIPDYIKDNQNNYDDAEVQQAISDLNNAIDNLQDQIDGSIETLYGDVDPSVPSNDPYKDYTTDEKEKHLGDMYYNSTTGYAYRYDKSVEGEGEQEVTTYFWQIIRDTGITQAIADAAAALGLADTKAKIFTTTAGTLPTPPYKVNDVWVNATYPANGSTYSNEILKCVTARAQGATANIADWVKASKYTDDSSLQNFISATYDPTIAGLTEQVDRKIESWFQSADPSAAWYDDTQTPVLDVRAEHVGDMWYSESTHLLKRYDSETTGEGEHAVTTYFWTTIQDQKAIDAYDNAAHAQDTADGKRRVFTAQPVAADAYDVGDLWVNATYPATGTKTYENDVLRCKTAKAAGEAFNISHWQKASKYTDDSALTNFINGDYANTIGALEGQLDKKAETWYQSANPANDWYVVDPETQEVTTDTRADHVGDLWYKTTDNTTWYYDATTSGGTITYEWKQQNVPLAVFDKIDGKADIFVSKPSTYNKYDMWIIESGLAAADMPTDCQSGDIVIAKNKRTNSYTKGDWEKKDRYTDDSAFNGYIDEMLNGSHTSGSDSIVAAATQRAIMSALGGSTIIAGGLMLTSMIALRQNTGTAENPQYTTWAGISGIYDNTLDEHEEYSGVKGHGIAAWYGGAKVDLEDKSKYWTQEQIAAWEALTDEQKAESPLAAKSLFRMDGSGYLATANISWNKEGAITIKNITTLSDTNNNNILNELATFNSAFTFGTSGQGSTTAVYIIPRVPFQNLYIGTSNDNKKEVATQEWVGNHYVSTDFFRQLFRAFKPNATAGQPDVEVEPNTIDNTISNIKAMVGLWTEQYLSALGQGSDSGGGGGSSVLYGLNDVSPNASHDGVLGAEDGYVLTYDGTTNHWYAAPTADVYTLPQATSSALGGIKIGYNASGKNYAVVLNNDGQAYVNVPWTDTTYTIAGLMGSAAKGGATQPIYWNGTAFVNTTYTLGKSVPSDALFTDTNTWRNILLLGTEKLGNGTDTKGLNFVGSDKTTITFLPAGTGDGKSGNVNYATLQISSTWRGIQDNLTSDSSTDSLSAKQGKALKGSITTLEGYFNSGAAKKADKLTTARSLWGNNFDGSAAVTSSIIISTAKSGETDKYIQIGDIKLVYDSTNDAIKVVHTVANKVANLWAEGGIAALGQTSSGGGGGSGDVTWTLLADNTDTRQIAISHLIGDNDYAGVLSILTGYSTSGKNYAVQEDSDHHLYVNVPWIDTNTWIAWVGATSSADGTAGYMPAPTSAQRSKFLRGDGSWVDLNNYSLPTASADTLGGIKVGTTLAISSGVLNQKSGICTAGTYKSVTVDTYGRVTAGTNPTTLSGYGITDAKIDNGVITLGANTITPLTSHQSVTDNNPTLSWGTKSKVATIGSTDIHVTMPTNPNTNTWRNILLSGTEKQGTGINTKGLNFVGDGKTTITFLAAGTDTGQSGSADYATLQISSTWRGIQDNLTSDSTTDSLSAKQGKALKTSITALEGYFTNGVANQATRLTAVTKTAWGRKYWKDNGEPDSISGDMSNVGNISFSATGKNIGGFLYFDTTNTRLGVNTSSPSYRLHVSGTFYASGNSSIGGTFGVTGATTLSSSLGVTGATTLTGLLTANGGIVVPSSKTIKIGDAILAWDSDNNAVKLYKLDSDSNEVAANFYALGGIAALGTTGSGGGGGTGDVTWDLLEDNTDYRQIAVSHLTTALSNYATTLSLNDYLPLSGGTMTGTLTIDPTNATGYQDGIILNDKGTGSSEGLYIKWTSASYTTGTMLSSDLANNELVFHNGTQWYNVLTASNSSVSKSGQTLTVKINGVEKSITNSTYTLAGLMGSTAIGGATQPIYWNGTAFANTSYTLGKSVPSDAVFTDTTYSVFTASANGLAPMASSGNKTTAETAVGNYYLCADGKYRQLPANAFLNSTYNVYNGTYSIKALVGSTTTTVSDFTANQNSADDFTLVQGTNITFTIDATNRKLTIAATDTTYTLGGLMGSTAIGSTTQPIYWTGTAFANTSYTLGKSVPSDAVFTDTKNTAGTTNKAATKLFLVGAESQAANPQTYSNVNVYIGTDNCLYSSGSKVLTSHQSLANYVKIDAGTTEQTIKNSISSLSKGVINLWRNSGDHYTFLGFSNGTTETYLGGIGFKSQSDHNLYRKQGTDYYAILDESNYADYAAKKTEAIKNITRSGTTFTATRTDGTTFTFTQQDNNTWTAWVGATSSANGTAGYMPAPTSAQRTQFLRGDGSWVSLNNYSLPLAASGTRGGVQIGYSESGKNYAVKLSSEKMYVNVPWTDTSVTAVGNHYAPAEDSTKQLDADATGGTASWSLDVVTGITVKRDAAGHVVGIAVDSGKTTAKPTYTLDDVADGSTRKLANYVKLAGDTMTGVLNIQKDTAGLLVLKRTSTSGGAFIDYNPMNQTTQYFRVGATSTKTDFAIYYYNGSTNSTPLSVSSTGVLTLGAANGTAPIVTSSKTVVSNLNADLLDGTHKADLFSAISSASGTKLSITIGGTTKTLSTLYASYAAQLTTARSLWGNSFNGSGDINGNITMASTDGTFIQIGAIKLIYDATNDALKIEHTDSSKSANFYAQGGVAALGTTGSGGGGGTGDVTWDLLADNTDTRQVALSHLTTALSGYAELGHTHTTTIATSTATNQITLAHGTKYAITAGGTSYVFTMPSAYSLPTASSSTLGGVKVGTTLAISSGVLNLATSGVTAGTYKRVTVDSYGRVTSGDNTDADTNTWRNIYVAGTEKLTTAITTKGLNFAAGSNVSISFAAAGTGDGQSGNANYGTLTISATDTTYSAATQSAAGLMSAADKKKLDGIATSANNYSLPLAASGTRGGIQIGYSESGKNYAVKLSSEKAYVNVPWTDTTYSVFTASANGLAPMASDANKTTAETAVGNYYLCADGKYRQLPANAFNNTTYSAGTADLISAGTNTSNRVWSAKILKDEMNKYLLKSGGTMTGTLTIDPTNASGYQSGIILNDKGTGSSEGLYIKWTSADYTTGTMLSSDLANNELVFHNGTQWYNVLTDANSSVSLSGSTLTVKINGVTKSLTNTNTTYESKAAASGGTAVSLVTTGEKYTWNSKAAGNHTHTTTIATSTGTNQLTLAFGTKYAITAGGTSYIFTMPSNPNTNTTYKFTIGSTTKGDSTNGVDLGTLKSETAAASGTTLSLVTTGEKATWNAKSNLAIGTTATTAAAGNHTHTLSIATDTGTNALTLAFGTKYKLTAGGNSFIFTMPSNPDTDVKVKVNATNPTTGTWYYPVWYTAASGTGNVNANDGFRYYSLEGTASALGESYLQIGNGTASGTAGNKRGHLRIYGNKAYYGEFNMVADLTANKTYTFSDEGTVLTSGNSSVSLSGSTLTVKINGVEKSLTNTNTNTTYTIATGDSNGQIKVTPSSGSAYNVSVKGLGSNAYTSTAYLPLSGGTITTTSVGTLMIERTGGANAAGLGFKNTNGVLGYIGMTGNVNGSLIRWNTDASSSYTILDSSNSSVSLSGSTLTVKINGVEKSLTNTNTTYSAGTGISLSGTTFSNSGVRATTINGNYLRVNTNGTNADLTIPYATNADTVDSQHATKFGWVYNSSNYGNSSTVTVNDLVSSGGSNATFGMVGSSTDNPTGAASWVHVWSQQWSINTASSWVSQIAIGTQAKNGMWYRATNDGGGIAGVAWKRVIDSSNIGSQSVNYATSAGNADKLDDWHRTNIQPLGFVCSNTASLSSYWAKAWTITVTNKQYTDQDVVMLVESAYKTHAGIILIKIRQTGSNGGGAYNFDFRVFKMCGSLPNNCVRLAVNNSTGVCDLWLDVNSQYGCYNITILKKNDNRYGHDCADLGTLTTSEFTTAQSVPALSTTCKQMESMNQEVWDLTAGNSITVSNNITAGNTISVSRSTTADAYVSANNTNGIGKAVYLLAATNRGVYVQDKGWIISTDGSNTSVGIGNFGIGTTSPSYKLHVAGTGYFTGDIILANNKSISMKDSGGELNNVLYLSSSNQLILGSETANEGYNTYLRGSSVYLQYGGSNTGLLLNSSGNVGIGTTSPSYKLHVSGDIYATGGVTSLSDIRKKNVVSYQLPLSVEQIANAPTIRFTWKDKREEGKQVGTIAQYWQNVLPEVVKDRANELSMQYGVAALVAAITTAKKVVDHEERIKALERECERLRTENEQLKLKLS